MKRTFPSDAKPISAVKQAEEQKKRKAVLAAHEQRKASGDPSPWPTIVGRVRREQQGGKA
jgi:hypothetical protein